MFRFISITKNKANLARSFVGVGGTSDFTLGRNIHFKINTITNITTPQAAFNINSFAGSANNDINRKRSIFAYYRVPSSTGYTYNHITNIANSDVAVPVLRHSRAVFESPGIAGYAAGGADESFVAYNNTHKVDFATKTSSSVANMTSAFFLSGGANGTPSSRLSGFVIGGLASGTTFNTVQEYNISADTWSSKANYPTVIHGLSSSAISNNIIHCVAGVTTTFTNACNKYNITTNSWSSASIFAYSVRLMNHYVVSGPYGYVGCGQSSGGSPMAYMQKNETATDTWSQGPDVINSTTGHLWGTSFGGSALS